MKRLYKGQWIDYLEKVAELPVGAEMYWMYKSSNGEFYYDCCDGSNEITKCHSTDEAEALKEFQEFAAEINALNEEGDDEC